MKKHYTIKVNHLLFATLLLLSTVASAQRIETLSGKKVSSLELETGISRIMDSLAIPGLSLAIINQNEVVYHNTFGVANTQTRAPISANSIFEGASLSKPIFAYFAMKMADKGTLDLDKPLHEYLPHPGIADVSAEQYRSITARMVLSHSTGFPNSSNGEEITLLHAPESGFSYSGEAYQYLAAVIGILNGVGWKSEFNAIFEKEVTVPLGMKYTSFLWNDHLAKHKVYGHDVDGNPTDNDTGGWSGKTFNAFSSIHSEAGEYARFIIAMLNQEGLSPKAFEEMLSTQNSFSATENIRLETGQTGWGLGFAQKPTPYGLMHLHTGNNHDFQAYAMFVPARDYGLVAFTNSDKMLPFLKVIENLIEEQF